MFGVQTLVCVRTGKVGQVMLEIPFSWGQRVLLGCWEVRGFQHSGGLCAKQ